MTFRAQLVDLSLDRVSKSYGKLTAVDEVSLRIGAGEMVSLLGPSGCGKTTCLRMIAGLIAPSAGTISVGGRDITGLPVHHRNIGMLFQSYALFPHMSVARNLAFGLEMRGIPKGERARRVAEALQMVKLDAYAERMPQALSGGQQQRVALARALIIEPSVLLLDEPLGALDKGLRESMQVELRQLQERLGITTVIVTHDQEEALTLSDRIVIMRNGNVEQFDTRRPSTTPRLPVRGKLHRRIQLPGGEGRAAGDGRTLLSADGGINVLTNTDVTQDRVTLLTRPEAVSVSALPADARPAVNAAFGTVEQRVYRGASVHVYTRLDDGPTILAYRPQGTDLNCEPGARVMVSWSEDKVRVLYH